MDGECTRLVYLQTIVVGQRIPVYYLPNNEMVVAKSKEEAITIAKSQFPELADLIQEELKQDEDVLDTWFSSWLWPISVFDGIRNPDNPPDIKYYYPTNDLITAPEILFFWVARMIMAGLEYRGEIPPLKCISHRYRSR